MTLLSEKISEIDWMFSVLNANMRSATKRKSDDPLLQPSSGGHKYGYLKDIHTKHKIKRDKTDSESEGKMLWKII